VPRVNGLDTSVVYGYTVGMAVKFDFDPKKAEANRHKHKVSFAQACDVWNDTLAIDEPDDRQDYADSTALVWRKAGFWW
jgi:uncharacterized DUF497 family protein